MCPTAIASYIRSNTAHRLTQVGLLLALATMLSLTACGRVETTATPDGAGYDMEPSTGAPAFVGLYAVSALSDNPECAGFESVWSIDRTAERHVYIVDTAADTPWIHAMDAKAQAGVLKWSESRAYTYSGCNYGIGFSYSVILDEAGNLQGTLSLRPDGGCTRAVRCDFAITGARMATLAGN